MLVDANLLLYATDTQSRFHLPAKEWLLEQLNGSRRVGLPWQSVGAFLRLATHPRVSARPLTPAHAWQTVSAWLEAPVAWIPQPGAEHAALLGELFVRHEAAGNLVPDALLAALALEHGLTVYSADTDFARFTEIRWQNPLA
ncbi:MAG TPA: TA system VapC family ribonuclease toxin [Solirubrobacterales bacterium]|nr:TA system VapC family ribonuclease toxin [Solirubrobacterales bacterium]